MRRYWLYFLFLPLFLAGEAFAQDVIDAKLLEEISRIRAIDNHMHGDAVDPARRARWKDENPLGKARYP